MNTIFNFSTFLKLIKTETYNFRKAYLYIAIALITFFAIHIWMHGQVSPILPLFNPFSWALIFMVPFIFYGKLYDKVQGVDYAMLPANKSEKFLAALTQCAIITPLFIGFIALVADFAIALVWNVNVSEIFHSAGRNYLETIGAQTLSFWACFWFRRNKIRNLVLTLCALALGCILIITVSAAIYLRLFADMVQPNYMDYIFFHFTNTPHLYFLFVCTLSLALWLLSFYKLARQQI